MKMPKRSGLINPRVEYQLLKTSEYKVFLDGKWVGKIVPRHGTYQYFPRGQKTGGGIYTSLSVCQQSIESEE